MSQNFFQIIRPVHVHLKTDKVDLKKRPPWKKNFLHFFSIDSSSRHEKRCQMLQTFFLLFQCSKNPRCYVTMRWNYFINSIFNLILWVFWKCSLISQRRFILWIVYQQKYLVKAQNLNLMPFGVLASIDIR